MLAEPGADGGRQGLEACWQIWPAAVLPLALPFTVQVTVVSEEFVTMGVSVARWPMAMEAEGGSTLTVTPLAKVTVADATSMPAVA